MTLEELQKALREGKAITSENEHSYIKIEDGEFAFRDCDTGELIRTLNYFPLMFDDILNDDTGYELFPNAPILTESERKYLSDVIRPFKCKYEIGIKKIHHVGENEAFISIELLNNSLVERICLPYFNVNEMYTGMELNKKYSLEELGL